MVHRGAIGVGEERVLDNNATAPAGIENPVEVLQE
jgi:hypothetical protein